MDVDSGRATASLGRAGAAMKNFGLDTKRSADNISHMGRTFDSFGSGLQRPLHTLRDYVLVLGNLRFALMNVRDLAVGWVWSLMKQAGELERLTILMRGFSTAATEAGKTQEATNNLNMLMNQARQTGFEVQTLADSFVKFQSAGLNPTTYSMRGLTEAVAKFGGNTDIMHRAAIAIQQMAGKGKISMEELRQQLGEAVPTAMRIMAHAMGMTVAQLGDAVKKGKVAAKPALELMLRDMEVQFGGAGKKLADTFFGQISQVKTNMMQLAADFTQMGNEEGLFAGAKESLKELNGLMRSGEGRQAMMQLGQAVANIAATLANGIKWVIEWRSEIGTVIVLLGKLWLVSKGAQVIGWMASMGMSAASTIRNMGTAAVTSSGHLATFTAASNNAVASIDRQRIASAAWVERTQASFNTATQAVAATRNQISTLTDLGQAYARNITILQAQQRQERANLQTAQTLHAANLAQGRSGATSAIMVKNAQDQLNTTTRSLISQQRLARQTSAELALAQRNLVAQETAVTAATARMTLAERANAISKGFMATAARACQGSISLLIAAVNLETGAVARATLAERAGAVAKGLYTTASRAAGLAASFMGRMASLALGPIGAIGLAAYTAAQYFGFFTDKANEAAQAAANLRGQMASLNDIRQEQARIDEIDKTLNADNREFGLGGILRRANSRSTISFLKSKEDLLRERQQHIDNIKGYGGNAYANAGHDLAATARFERQNYSDRLSAQIDFIYKKHNLDARMEAGDKAAFAEANRLRDRKLALDKKVINDQLTIARQRRQAAINSHDTNAVKKYDATIADLRTDLEGVSAQGLSATRQMEALGAVGGDPAGGAKRKGGGRGIDGLANSVGNLNGEIAALDAKLKGDVSTNLTKFNATLEAGGFKGKTPAEIELMRRKAALQDALADANRSQKGENSYESVLASMTGRLAELNDELKGGEGNLAKFNAQLNAGKFKGLSEAQIEKLRSVAAEIDKAEFNGRIKDLNKDLAKATEEADAVWGAFNTGAQTAAKRLAGLRAGFEDKLIGLSGEQLKEAEATINRIVAKLNEAEAGKLAKQWSDDAFGAQTDMMGENEARQMAFERERAQRKLQLDSFLQDETINIERRKQLQKNFSDWEIWERRRVDRANESQMVKQLRDWASLGQAIQQTMTQAMSSFVDGLAEGKFAFKDFAKELLKQLLKIILQAMIAYAILSAMGMSPTGTNGQKMNFGSFLQNSFAQGLGGGSDVTWEKHHTGGVIGDGRGAFKFSDAMMSMAHKYHTGGGIGRLGPKEVPLIGLEGERVLNEEQQRQLGRDIAENGASKAPPVTINFINNSSEPLTAEQSDPQFNGKEMVIGIVVESLTKQGRLRDAVAAVGKDGH
jgi:tape measure domain-containing protein